MSTAIAPAPLRSWCNYSHLWIEFASSVSGLFTVNAKPGNNGASVEIRSVDGTTELKTNIDRNVYATAEQALREGDKNFALHTLLGAFSFVLAF